VRSSEHRTNHDNNISYFAVFVNTINGTKDY
jgi:hypothetical protein